MLRVRRALRCVAPSSSPPHDLVQPSVPSAPTPQAQARQLVDFIRERGGRNVVVLTGAGCSTESGIPDYRGPNGRYRRADFVPLTVQRFLKNEEEQKRYWIRSLLGYSHVHGASSNATHVGLYELQVGGVVSDIITQNVDGLHHLAAHGGVGTTHEDYYHFYTQSPSSFSSHLHEIHGNIHLVQCMKCKDISPRIRLQRRLHAVNESLFDEYAAQSFRARPDGDFDFPDDFVQGVQLCRCEACNTGNLKPYVVLFGDNVPGETVSKTLDIVRNASCLVCVGTSLQVYSAYRYVAAAAEQRVPIAIINAGVTRGDALAALKLETDSVASVIQGAARELL